MIILKTEEEIELLRKSNMLVSRTLAELSKHIKPGVTTIQLDNIAEEFIRDNGAIPTFKGFPNHLGQPFPGSICASVNDVVVHGIPNKTPLEDGDIISIDCGVFMNGFCGDSAYTFAVGNIDSEVKRLLDTTKKSLFLAIDQAFANNRLGDIGHAVQSFCESASFGVVREFVGHGIGKDMHEEPQVPNYGRKGYGKQLKKGMCIAIEPMVTLGNRHVAIDADGWTVRTVDRKPAAHFEHSIAIGVDKADVLSSFEVIEIALKN